MKRFFHKMSGFLKYGAVFIAGGLYIWAIIILLNEDNWIGISTITTLLLAIAAFWTIWQNYKFRRDDRKNNALLRIRVWAENSIELLTISSPSEINKALEQIKTNTQIIRAKSISELSDADIIGGEVKQKVQKAVHDFNDFTDEAFMMDAKFDGELLLKNLLLDFKDVINVTTKNMKT